MSILSDLRLLSLIHLIVAAAESEFFCTETNQILLGQKVRVARRESGSGREKTGGEESGGEVREG